MRAFAALVAIAGISSAILLAKEPAAARAPAVVVNGQAVVFDQPPILRKNRVFVPLRGVFERLGASVVWTPPRLITAQRGSTSVGLHIGSTTAVVNGATVTIDVPPFLVGGRTLVPLRFISQALGATVNWVEDSFTVFINLATAGAAPATVTLVNLNPPSGGVVAARRPSISGSFSQSVDPNSVKITLDGRDVSSSTYVSATTFLFVPQYDLVSGSHTVEVKGNSQAGASFDQSWSFTSGVSTVHNFITNMHPPDGSKVSGTFTILAATLPGSSVHIVAIATSNVFGVFPVGTGTYVTDVTADSLGRFSAQVVLSVSPGGGVSMRITSTAPTTRAGAVATLHYNT